MKGCIAPDSAPVWSIQGVHSEAEMTHSKENDIDMDISHDADTVSIASFCTNENTRDSGIGLFVDSRPRAQPSSIYGLFEGSRVQHDTTSSSGNEDTSDDSSGGSSDGSWLPSWVQSNGLGTTAISPDMAHCNLFLTNATKEPLNCFNVFISEDWPKGWRGELQALELQLMHGGEFSTNMKEIDLSTPSHIRLNASEVLPLLEKKMMNNKFTVEQIKKFVLPNIEEVTSGDMIKEMIESYCRAVGGKGTPVIKHLIIKCDEVSSNFAAGKLKWINGFRACNNLDVITVSYALEESNHCY